MKVHHLFRPTEHQEQKVVVEWWSYACKSYGLPHYALMAYPAGGLRHKSTAGKLKAEGVRRGVPDLLLPIARGPYIGCAIEMKSESGRVRDAQQSVIDWLRSEGWCVAVCYNSKQAVDLLERYLKLWSGAKGAIASA